MPNPTDDVTPDNNTCDAILRECDVMSLVDGFRLEPKVDIDFGRRIVRASYLAALRSQATRIAELEKEFVKVDRLWKLAEISRERAETTLGGMENAVNITLARAERAEAVNVTTQEIEERGWYVLPQWDEECALPTEWVIRGRAAYGSVFVAKGRTLADALNAARTKP